jgi:tripartite ATP-independent transporter DctM subunit
MTSLTAGTTLFAVFFALIALRVPVSFALGLASMIPLFLDDRLSPMMLFNQTFRTYDSFLLIAVPFFLMTANLMNAGGVTDRLMRLSKALVGHFPGGLAQVNVVLSFFFAGVSGSSTADAASQGRLFVPAQVKQGYGLSFSVAITAVASILAQIIPPSINMIIWGGTMSVSISGLFIAGIVPGILLTLTMMMSVWFLAKSRGYPVFEQSTLGEIGRSAIAAIPALMTPVIIISGKVAGLFTATEAAAIAVCYTIVLALFLREMTLRDFLAVLKDTGVFTGATVFTVGTASIFGWLLAYYQIPKFLLSGVEAWELGAMGTGFLIAAVFLIVGAFLDAIPAIIIVGTIMQPLAAAAGIHPIHFGMIGIIALAFGFITPPYGICLLITCGVSNARMIDVLPDVLRLLVPLICVLGIVVAFPDLVLGLPKLIVPEFVR